MWHKLRLVMSENKKKGLALVAFFLFLITYRILYSTNTPTAQMEKIVEVERVKRKDFIKTENVIGTIRSDKQTVLKAKSRGVLHLVADAGQRMQKGTLIAFMKNEDAKTSYELVAEAQKIAKTQLERAEKLFKSGVLSQNNLEKAKENFLVVQKNLSDAKANLEDLNIYAPFDGVVGVFKHWSGSEVSMGDHIVSIYDPRSIIVEFSLPLSIAKKVKDGDPITIDQKAAQLAHVQKMLDENTHMCPAFAKISCQDCVIGTSVDVALEVISKQDVLIIPFDAVFLRDSKPFVYTVKDNKATLTPITLGTREKKEVEITEGLTIDDRLIVYGHHRLYPDEPVKIHIALPQAIQSSERDIMK
jgi:membrane fusion protein, multidrug efflux system